MNEQVSRQNAMDGPINSLEAWHRNQQSIMFRARQERARVVREGLLWLVAAARRSIDHLIAEPKGSGTVTGKPSPA